MDVLHELIAGMSMAERSYFKRYSAKLGEGSSTNYIRLFDAIAAQGQYNEAAIKKLFASEKFVKQFSVAKAYLYKTVIRALRNFREESSIQSSLKHLQLELDILMDKGIYTQAMQVIDNGIKLARQYEMLTDLNEFVAARLYMLMHNYQPLKGKETIDDVIAYHLQLGRQIDNLVQFENLYQQQHRLNKTVYQLRDGKQLKDYDTIFSNPLLQSKSAALTGRALYLFHFIRCLHFSVTDRRADFLAEAKKLVAVCYATPYFKQYDYRGTMNALNLLLEAAYFNHDWAAMNKALKQLQAVPVQTDRDKIAAFIYYSRFALIYFDQKKDSKAMLKLMEEAWVMLKRYEQKIPYHVRVNTMVTYSSVYLEMGEYAKALDWIELYRQGKKEEAVRFDSQSILLMMQLIAHYEMGNLLLVKNIVPNISRFIKKVGQQSKFEKVLLAFFNKLTSAKAPAEGLFEKTLNELNGLQEGDILNRNRTMHDIFRVFIQSKMHKKKYHEAIGH
ncbi:MAG TPA: hypothetical protein VK174_02395 [Chitinophagales bacterium]|nr:hypothetical protein [Chitinophagales bacterium]